MRKELSKPSMEPNWSETIYKVIKVQGQTILLDDGTKYKRYNLLKIPDDTDQRNKSYIYTMNYKMIV